MNFLEKNLEDIIYSYIKDNEGVEMLKERGLNVGNPYKVIRQLKIGNYGIADIVTMERPKYWKREKVFNSYHVDMIKISIYELKKDLIDSKTFFQALRYAKGIISYLYKYKNMSCSIELVLIGNKIDCDSEFVYLTDFLNYDDFNLRLIEYNYDIDGLKFGETNSYCLTNEGF